MDVFITDHIFFIDFCRTVEGRLRIWIDLNELMQITTMLHLTQVAAMNFASHKQHFTMTLNALHRIEPTTWMPEWHSLREVNRTKLRWVFLLNSMNIQNINSKWTEKLPRNELFHSTCSFVLLSTFRSTWNHLVANSTA